MLAAVAKLKHALPCLLSVSLLHAAPHDPWVRIRSANFELFTTAGERTGRDLIHYFEQVHSFFQQAFALDGTAAQPVRIVSFRSDKEYLPYRPTEVADAFFEPGFEHDYIVMKNPSTDLYPTAIHEYTHMLLRQTKLDVPPWLNEGLAELYSSLEPEGSKIVVGKVIPGRIHTLARDPWIDLRTLVSAGANSPLYSQKAHAEMFYAESWALVHMLTLDERYSPSLRAMMDALKDGDSVGAFQKAYGKPIGKVQEDLKAYFDGNRFNAAVFDIQLPAEEEEPAVEPGAAMLARLALAELMSNDRTKLDQALAAYKTLSRDYENRWEIEQGWAEFLARERRSSEAVAHFARAAGLGANDPRMYVKYARVLNLWNRTGEAAEALKTAVRLDPALDDAHFELAVTLVRIGNDREALAEFHAIKHLGPENAFRYFYNLAEAHYRLGDIARARLLIEKGRSQTHNPEQIAALNRLRQLLDGPPK
jgi:tetratricopeptide (TPR) repeat protein